MGAFADNHKGFCIILDRDEINKSIKLFPEITVIDTCSVDYYGWLHEVQSEISIQHGGSDDLMNIKTLDLIKENDMTKSILFKKDKDWENESEYRWLVYSEKEEDIFIPIEKSIKAVVLGANFPTNQISQAQSYCKDLRCACYLLEYRHPKYELKKLID